MAETYAKLKRFPEALEAYRKAVELKPTADAFGILASAYARMGKYQEAVQAYQQAMKLEPGFAQTWNRLSEVYIKLEDFEKKVASGKADEHTQKNFAKLRQEQEALESFKETIRQKPNDPESYLRMGQLYIDLNLPAKALDFLKHALRLKMPGSSVHRCLGIAYMSLGQIITEARRAFQEAAQDCKKMILKHGRRWVNSIRNRASMTRRSRRIKKHCSGSRKTGIFIGIWEMCIVEAGRYADATSAYWQAIHLNPQDGLARYSLGVTYVRLNQRPYAIEQKSVLRTIDAKLAAELDHVIWRLNRETGSKRS